MDQPVRVEKSIPSDDAQVSHENELTPLDSEVLHHVAGGGNGTIIIQH